MIQSFLADGLVRISDLKKIFRNEFKYTKSLVNQTAAFTIAESVHKKGKYPLVSFLDNVGNTEIIYTVNTRGDVSIGAGTYTGTIVII